jgi:hypothetical protein
VRPATVFGSEDRFLNWIADATTKLPLFPLINSGCNLVQPVYANDVGKALAELVKVFNSSYNLFLSRLMISFPFILYRHFRDTMNLQAKFLSLRDRLSTATKKLLNSSTM